MTYGELKKRIYSLLDIDGREESTAGTLAYMVKETLVQTVNAVARKTAAALKALYKTETLYFEKAEAGIRAVLPDDAALVKEIYKDRRRYGAVSFEKVGNTLYFFGAGEGFYTIGYYAVPKPLAANAADGLVLEMDDTVWDTVAYGVGAELCMKVYPSDMKRYMRLATEFDDRVTNFPSAGASALRNRVFAKRRGF